jgi:hypothetical protein
MSLSLRSSLLRSASTNWPSAIARNVVKSDWRVSKDCVRAFKRARFCWVGGIVKKGMSRDLRDKMRMESRRNGTKKSSTKRSENCELNLSSVLYISTSSYIFCCSFTSAMSTNVASNEKSVINVSSSCFEACTSLEHHSGG